MKKNQMTSSNISVVHFENNKIPTFKEVKGRDWILCGDKNDYPNYLINLFNRSSKHNAIITGKVQYIKGEGLKIDESKVSPEKLLAFKTVFNIA